MPSCECASGSLGRASTAATFSFQASSSLCRLTSTPPRFTSGSYNVGSISSASRKHFSAVRISGSGRRWSPGCSRPWRTAGQCPRPAPGASWRSRHRACERSFCASSYSRTAFSGTVNRRALTVFSCRNASRTTKSESLKFRSSCTRPVRVRRGRPHFDRLTHFAPARHEHCQCVSAGHELFEGEAVPEALGRSGERLGRAI